MPRIKKTAAQPKARVGRPTRTNAEHRLDLRRRKASTSLRIADKDLALFEKLAEKWKLTLPEAFERVVTASATRAKVHVAQDPSADLGWS